MMDQDGRVYYTAQFRSPKDPPDYCKKDSALRSAQLYPLAGPQSDQPWHILLGATDHGRFSREPQHL